MITQKIFNYLKKEINFFINNLVYDLLCLFSFFLLAYGVLLLGLGYHNIDFAYNYVKLTVEINPYLAKQNLSMYKVSEVEDKNFDGQLRTLSQGYSNGIIMLFKGVFFIFLSGITLAFYFSSKNTKK